MLATTRKKPPETSLHKYLNNPDVNNNKWKSRNRGEKDLVLCNQEIELTEELKIYLLYFSSTSGEKPNNSLTSFSNIPIKTECKSSGEFKHLILLNF